MEKITLNLSSPCDILIGEGIAGGFLKKKCAGRKTFVLADGGAADGTGFSFGFCDSPCRFRGGEENKTFSVLGEILSAVAERRIGRDGLFVSFGGGVVGDLGGLAASLYMRGIEHVLVPTTLLAMADSSVGGKTAVDFGKYKNLVGTFYQPSTVVVDTAFLSSLPDREWLSGRGEIVKTALLSPEIGKKIRENPEGKDERSLLVSLLPDCIRFKGGIVAEDEREKTGRRKILNAGHTVGHMLEMNYGKKSHGEYVLEGLYYENRMAEALGIVDSARARETEEFLLSYLPRPHYANLRKGAETAFLDKKNRGDLVSFVAVAGEGRTEEVFLTQKRFGELLDTL